MICAECGKKEVTSQRTEETLCRVCHEQATMCANWVERRLLDSGMAPKEIAAKWEDLPEALRDAIAAKRGSLGLTGPVGTGKTYAAAATARKILTIKAKELLEYVDPLRGLPNVEWLGWVPWPEMVGRLRGHGAIEHSEEWLSSWCQVPVLVLDDVGSERIKGSYSEDWAASFLDRIVDNRYRFERMILWTTNLSATELTQLYGSRLMSRLLGPNPLITIPGTKDQRLGGKK